MDMSTVANTKSDAVEAAKLLRETVCGTEMIGIDREHAAQVIQAAIDAAVKPYRTFLHRCADHMIGGSNIADTPLPTEEEWKEILK